MILNQNIYYIGNDTVDIRRSTAYHELASFDDHDYVYVEFKYSLAKLIDCLTPDSMLDKIVNGKVHLILCNSHEAFHDVVAEIYQRAVIELEIPAHKILFLSESADILSEVKTVATRLQMAEIKTIWTRIFEWGGMRHSPAAAARARITLYLKNTSFTKSFLNLNRRWRLHRPALVALLFANNLLDKGHVSLAPVEGNTWDSIWYDLTVYHNLEINNILQVYGDEIRSLPPMYLDTTDLITNQAEYSTKTRYLYNDSYFSVVSETNYYAHAPGRFLSEKVFKPIHMLHPFIMVSRPHSMKLLTELGYKTFEPYINESYDSIEDDSARLLAIVQEIKRLSYLSPEELRDFLVGTVEICRHNLQTLVQKTNFITRLN